MYHEIKGGSVEDIYGYKCHIPPVGYGKNRLTGELEYVGVIERSKKPSEQLWERIELPKDWDKKVSAEEQAKKIDENHVDPYLEKIREQHWKYRLCGLWVMINGKPIYFTYSFYFYLNWCPLDTGYADYWESDRKFFYVWEYCVEDPFCGGMADIEGRRSGKTYKSGSILLDRTSLFRSHHSGIQSKTNPDAKGIFQKTIIGYFKKLPEFFRPVFDQSQGLTPKTELRFFQTNIKGNRALQLVGTPELESWIDFGSSEPAHYDGMKLNTYYMDEFGKTIECSIWQRWEVVKFCLMDKGKWIGKAILTSTIEDQDNTNDDPKKLWAYSNPNERNANGRTKSGLYRYFVPAYDRPLENGDKKLYDKFGIPDKEKALAFIINERAGLQSDPASLSALIRKMPLTIEEAFRIDANTCLYDDAKLNEQLDSIAWKDNLITRGNFEWVDGEAHTKVQFRPNKNGRFEVTWLFEKSEEANRVINQNGQFVPMNTHSCVAGVDPFKFDEVKDQRRSDCAGLVFKKFDILCRDELHNEAFVCQYKFRASTTSMQYDDILKMCWYYGCQALIENNIGTAPKDYFTFRKCKNFLMVLPGESDPGIYTDGQGQVKQQLADYTQSYIAHHINKVFFKDLIIDWLKFDIGKTTKFDLAMAAGFALIASKRKIYKRDPEKTTDITHYFRTYSTDIAHATKSR